MLQAKATGPQVSCVGHAHDSDSFSEPVIPRYRFISTPSGETLRKLGLRHYGYLIENGDSNARATQSAAQGGEKYMSSRDMYRHLNFLQEHVPVCHQLPHFDPYSCTFLG